MAGDDERDYWEGPDDAFARWRLQSLLEKKEAFPLIKEGEKVKRNEEELFWIGCIVAWLGEIQEACSALIRLIDQRLRAGKVVDETLFQNANDTAILVGKAREEWMEFLSH